MLNMALALTLTLTLTLTLAAGLRLPGDAQHGARHPQRRLPRHQGGL